MPVVETIEESNYQICIWSITESAEDLISLSLPSNRAIASEIQHEQRQREWLACRAALGKLEGSKTESLYKDEHGKPHLKEGNFISISHTEQYAIAMSGTKAVGVDIEKISDRILRIADRFIHEDEDKWLDGQTDLKAIYLIWCAKEAMYKLYGKQAISFKEHIQVQRISTIEQSGKFTVRFLKPKENFFTAHYRFIDGHALVWIESPTDL